MTTNTRKTDRTWTACFGSRNGTLDINITAATRRDAEALAPDYLRGTVLRPEDWQLNAVQEG